MSTHCFAVAKLDLLIKLIFKAVLGVKPFIDSLNYLANALGRDEKTAFTERGGYLFFMFLNTRFTGTKNTLVLFVHHGWIGCTSVEKNSMQ
jgi:hypothetical protein